MQKNDYIFEVLVIDKSGLSNITKDLSLINGLLYSEQLWKTPGVFESNDTKKIIDKEQGIELRIHPVDTKSALTDYIEAAFVIKIKGQNYELLEKFRQPFLIHLKRKLEFSNIRILRDDISTKISNDTYPLINQVENILRRYLVLFFTQKIGVDWWDVTAPRQLSDKISIRKNNEKIFSTIVDTDVTLIDFNDLGELIYKQTSGFNRQENIITRIMTAETADDLNVLKIELQGNYTKYFKEAFQDNNFEKKWKTLFDIRNKVAHNNLFVMNDYLTTKQVVEDLTEIISEAESKIDTFKFSIEEQEAIRQATIEAVKVAEIQNETKSIEKFGIKIIGKIDLPEENDYDDENPFRIITEDDLLKELDYAEKSAPKKGLAYVGLKTFVTKLLGAKGYSFGPTYSLINILNDRGVLDIYEAEDDTSYFQPKAIRRKIIKK